MADDIENPNIDPARREMLRAGREASRPAEGAARWPGPCLLAFAIICALASYGIERFGHELCHRGLPLAALTLGTPIVGAMAGLAALFRRSRAWIAVIKVVVAGVNAWQLASALIVMAGVGIASCG